MENSPGQRPWFERMMEARTDPVWVAFALFMAPGTFLVFSMVVATVDAIART